VEQHYDEFLDDEFLDEYITTINDTENEAKIRNDK